MLDDMLIIVMRGGLTTAEKTMLAFGQPDQVRQFRQLFENEVTERLCDMIARLTGRTVVTYPSQIMFDPHIGVEMFVFDAAADPTIAPPRPSAQTRDPSIGEATDDDALDRPSTAGQ